MITFLSNLGVSPDLPPRRQQRIRLVNQVLFLLMGINLLSTILVMIIIPDKFWLPFPLFAVYALGFVLNYSRAYTAAALFAAVAESLFVFFVHIAFIRVNEPPIESLNLYSLSLLLLPWVLLDLDQKPALIAGISINLACVVLVKPASGLIEFEFDTALVRTELAYNATLFSSALTMIGALAVMKQAQARSERQNGELVTAMQGREQAMHEQAEQMNLTIAKLKEKEQAETQQAWLSEGLIALGHLQQQHTEANQLADRALAFLVKRVKADQAGLFLIRAAGESSHLYLAASYAYDRKKYLEKKIELGEGLVGQTYLENETTVINQLPPGYSAIASSLGQAAPQQLVLVPLRTDQQSLGVLEIASFTPLAPHQIEFLERAAQSLATAVQSTNLGEKMRHLLQQAQQQTEELRAREEEMRQNLEELTATQEEMRRISFMSKQVFEAVNALVGYVELATDRRVLAVNQIFAEALGYQPASLIGQSHQNLARYIPSQEYEVFWQKLLAGKIVEGHITRQAKNGQLVTFHAVYQPVFNGQGQVEKIIKFAYQVKNALSATQPSVELATSLSNN
ncbi:MAG: GAF domain-containing protein [Bernardetiaceae bacterium]|jgi:PAS domain S-box-containing protein|nr:GAF domain-containing protein [Bernardetiaceae bacterium]